MSNCAQYGIVAVHMTLFFQCQIYQSKRKFSQKSMFSTLKVKRSQKFVWRAIANISEKKKSDYKYDQ
jgi:hypothetical protein